MDGDEDLVVVKEENFENYGVATTSFGGSLKEESKDDVKELPGFVVQCNMESSHKSAQSLGNGLVSVDECGLRNGKLKLPTCKNKMKAETPKSHKIKSRMQLKKKRRKPITRIVVKDDIVLLQEVLSLNPFGDNEIWDEVTENARAAVPKGFTRRNVKERVMYLLKSDRSKQPKKRSGTQQEYALRDQLLQDVKEMRDSSAQHPGNKSASQRGAPEENEETMGDPLLQEFTSAQHPQNESKAAKEVITPLRQAIAASLSASRSGAKDRSFDSQGNVELQGDQDVPVNSPTDDPLSGNPLSPSVTEIQLPGVKETLQSNKKIFICAPKTVQLDSSTPRFALRTMMTTPEPMSPMPSPRGANVPAVPPTTASCSAVPPTPLARLTPPLHEAEFTTLVASCSGSSTPTSLSYERSPKAKRRRKSSMQVDQFLNGQYKLELMKAKLELVKEENEKKRLEIEEKRVQMEEKRGDSMDRIQSKLFSLMETHTSLMKMLMNQLNSEQ